jgi:hypothetical protein
MLALSGVLQSGSRRYGAERRPPSRKGGTHMTSTTTVLAIALLLATLVIDRLAK